MTEANLWAGETPGKEQPPIVQSAPMEQVNEPAVTPVPERDPEVVEHKYVLSDDKSGHYVEGAYERMVQRVGHVSPEPQVASKPAEAAPIYAAPVEDNQTAENQRVSGGEKYRVLLERGRVAVTQNEASLYLILAPKNWTDLSCSPAGKNKFGENIYEIVENNVTIGFSDHDITSDVQNTPDIRYN